MLRLSSLSRHLRPSHRACGLATVASNSGAAAATDVTLYTAKSTFPAFNGWKLTILLEELRLAGALSFSVRELDLDALEHKEQWYLKINPNGRIPAIVDHKHGGISVWESGAIMMYLAEHYGHFMPLEDTGKRYSVIQWLCFQLSGIGPMQGQAHAFLRYVPEQVPYAISRYQTETRRLYEVVNTRLADGEPFVAGAEYTIADMALFPWCAYHQWAGVSLEGLPHLQTWIERVGAREGVQKGLAYNSKPIQQLLAGAEAIRTTVGATTLDKAAPVTPAEPTGLQTPSATNPPHRPPTHQQPQQHARVFNLVLTGGPCGGKSSSQELLSSKLSAQGFSVFFVPEVPSLLITGGAAYPGLAPENAHALYAFEHGIISTQIALEDAFQAVAAAGDKPGVVVYDRGLLDVAAYLPRTTWLGLLEQMGYTEAGFAARYDMVLHLATTAHGLEDVYEQQKANNPARTETASEARALDDKVLECWSAHPTVVRLGNDTDGFVGKLEAGLEAVRGELQLHIGGV